MHRIKVLFNDIQDVKDFYDVAAYTPCDIDIGRGITFYDAKSILGLLNLRFGEAQYLTFYSEEDFSDRFKRWIIE